ncbi:hypothetical protein AMS68_003234 [Peltaster fructicola]|uniref:Uncharacterized protein n=1 Tax=Peltaster fructicola TaxID=286661 RepID=A0A6H0XSH8_9PEZI|nr:hypothetical protein AMS68_003234 [Peltaster fructicola]
MAPTLRQTANRASRTDETVDRSQLPDSYFTDIILGAEAEFLAASERKRLGDGSPFPTQSTKGWYIPAIEGGPTPYRTKAEFETAQERLVKESDNADIVHQQLFKFSVVDGLGHPLGMDKQPLEQDTAIYAAMKNLIEKYQYELEPDEHELDNIKHIPNYKPRPNAFSAFMGQRKKIFKRFNVGQELSSDEDKLASDSEDAGPSYKRRDFSDSESEKVSSKKQTAYASSGPKQKHRRPDREPGSAAQAGFLTPEPSSE